MTAPHDVLSELLSPEQATVLDSAGRSAWNAAAGALEAAMARAPLISGVEARLVMPEEIASDFQDSHLVAPLEISSDQDQSALAYVIVNTAEAAQFFGSEADDPMDQEQQTLVLASTVLGHVLSAINRAVLEGSQNALTLSLDDLTANAMPQLLAAMEDPALVLQARIEGASGLAFSLILPGTFLDIAAGGMPLVEPFMSQAEPKLDLPFTLTADELDAAALVDEPVSPPPIRTPEPEPQREPTPISRARFAPLPDPEVPPHRTGIDLLAGLEMNVRVELGRTELTVAEVLGLGAGSVIELDRLAGEPVDILVNDRLIARGEVVVVDENFGVRVVEVVRRGADVEERVG